MLEGAVRFPFIALLSASALAQSLDLPVATQGGTPISGPFSTSSIRVQCVYPLLGKTPRVFRQLGLRREGGLPNNLPGPGNQDPGEARSFNPLRIVLGRGSVGGFGNNLDANYIGAPTEVFRRAISLPAAKDQPTHPMPWASAYSFGFQGPYLHLGTSDLLVDISVDQGRLANSNPWTRGSLYMMDGWRRRETEYAWANFYTSPSCPLQLQVGGVVGRNSYGVPAAAYLGVMNASGSTQFVVGLGLQGVRQPGLGVPIPASCQPLMMQPLVTLTASTSSAGRFDIFLYRGAYLPAVTGVPVFAQAAFAGATGPQLTNSAELRMPSWPDLTVRARMKVATPASSSTALPSILPDTYGLSLRLQ